MNRALLLLVHRILLGGGKAVFAGVEKRRSLGLVKAESTESGRVSLTYRAWGSTADYCTP